MAMMTKMMREEIHVRNYNSWLSYTEKKFKNPTKKNDELQQQPQNNKTHNQQFFFVK